MEFNASLKCCKLLLAIAIGHATVVRSVTWPMNACEAGGDFALIQTSLPFSCKCQVGSIYFEELNWRNQSSEICSATRSLPALLPSH